MRFGWLVGVSAFLIAAEPAMAQQQITGIVTILKTPAGSVLVERGSEVYQLREGDVLFAGDRIFTRTNGAIRFTFSGCDVGLGGQQTMLVDTSVCSAAPVTLASSDVVGGITVGTGGEVAPTPTILLSLLTAGGLAAGAAGGGSNSQSAPTAVSP